jgi:hypothetical protein
VTAPPESAGVNRPTRHEFARALVEHSWANPAAPRPAARPHVVLMVAALALAVAVGTGAILQLVHPIPMPKPPAPPPVPAAPFTAVTGWNCDGGGGASGFDAQGRTSAWSTIASGGWPRNGCDGTFEAIPLLTKKASQDQSQNQSAVWWFKPTAEMTACTIMVYRPAPPARQDSAVTAAHFDVLSGQDGTQLATFVLNEATDPGSWAMAGTYPVSPEGIAVELVDRWEPSAPGDLLAITQVKVKCTG